MIRWFRRKLAYIRYYSANRPRTAWDRAADAALIIALLLSVPAALTVNLTVHRDRTLDTARGGIAVGHSMAPQPDGMHAWLVQNDDRVFTDIDGRPYADFELTLTTRRYGWPVTTTIIINPVALNLNRFDDPQFRSRNELADDAPEIAAIERALNMYGDAEMHDAWRRNQSSIHHLWLAWIASVVLWWFLLSLLFSVIVLVLRLMFDVRRQKRNIRRRLRWREGRCGYCDYDLTGLEFNERCPECGGLIR